MLKTTWKHRFSATAIVAVLATLTLWPRDADAQAANFLLITVDDMSCDSVGVYGSKVAGTTPHIDKLAAQGMRFDRAHVTIAVCQPTRAVWMTGRYPHRNGALGFQQISPGIPTLLETLKSAGFFTGIFGKTTHVIPSRAKAFDVSVRARALRVGRSPERYAEETRKFLESAKATGKRFFLMANAHDPHRPFAGSRQEQARKAKNRKQREIQKRTQNKKRQDPKGNDYPDADFVYRAKDIVVPKFLPDIPPVRREIAQYYTSVRRADQVAGAVLDELERAGLAENTLVMFLSDHGMPLPFAKTNCYYHSTRTPWIVRWPGKTKAGSVDEMHGVSGIDLTPTALDALGLPPIEGVDGRSFTTLLTGGQQDGREFVFTQFHRTAGRKDYEMRSIIGPKYGYIFNDWADGKTVFKNESQAGLTMKAMRAAAKNDARIAERVDLFLHRVPEEFFDYSTEPDALHNLIDSPEHREELEKHRARLLAHLAKVKDPLLTSFSKQRAAGKSAKSESEVAGRTVAGRALAGWVADLSHDNEFVRLRAVKTLGAFDEAAIPALKSSLEDASAGVRYWAASHLGKIGKPAASSKSKLLALLKVEKNPAVVLAANFALCRVDQVDSHLGGVTKFLEYPERGMASSAAEFLGKLGTAGKSAVPALEKAYRRHTRGQKGADHHVKGAAQNALRKIQPGWNSP